jgi:twitching motility two-component system response regulator PilH
MQMQTLTTTKVLLVVEDMPMDQKMISGLLQRAGYQVTTAASAEDAWKYLQQHDDAPSAIILDIILPGDSGLNLCRKIRGSERLKQIPIIFCSSKDKEADRFWALRQGGNEYITKPFTPNQLLDVVRKYV